MSEKYSISGDGYFNELLDGKKIDFESKERIPTDAEWILSKIFINISCALMILPSPESLQEKIDKL
ncbi:MAG: hypothetical protein AB8G05_23770 [Oligoflexales bacterium]